MLSIHGVVNSIFSVALFINAALFIPQAIHIVKNKTAAGLSLLTFLGFLCIQAAVVLHSIIIRDYLLLGGYLLSMLTCGVVVTLIFIYKKSKIILKPMDISLEDVFEQLPGHVYWKDQLGTFIISNKNNWQNFGLKSLADFQGKNDYDWFTKEEADRLRVNDQEVMRTGQFNIIEEKVTKADGTTALYLSHKIPLKTENNEVVGVLGVSIDITTAKQAREDRLNMLENIIAVMPGNVYWMDTEGVYLGCNNNAASALGLSSRQEIIGKRNIDMRGFVIPEVLDPVNKQVMQEGKTSTLEEPAVLADGTNATFISHKVPLYNGRHEIMGMVGISFDITKQQEMQLLLEKEKISRAKLEFISMASHEIKNPVANVVSVASVLEDDLRTLQDLVDIKPLKMGSSIQKLLKQVFEQCNAIQVESERSLVALKNLSDLYLMQSKGVKTNLVTSRVSHLIEVALQRSPYSNRNNLNVIIDIQEGVPERITTDFENISVALGIIIGNAFRFSYPNEEVRIQVKHKEGENALTISVRDSGIGMHELQIRNLSQNLLDPHASKRSFCRKPSVQLSCARMYLEAFKGSLLVESVANQGTMVTLTISYHLPEPGSADQRFIRIAMDDLRSLKTKRKIRLRKVNEPLCSVLLVEEDDAMRLATYTKLIDLGCDVDAAANSTNAVRLLSRNDYDIAFIDIALLNINGMEVMRQVRHIKAHQPIFIAISSHTSLEDEAYVLEKGMTALLAKSVSERQLEEAIELALNVRDYAED